jgi:hypothetical protein
MVVVATCTRRDSPRHIRHPGRSGRAKNAKLASSRLRSISIAMAVHNGAVRCAEALRRPRSSTRMRLTDAVIVCCMTLHREEASCMARPSSDSATDAALRLALAVSDMM